MTWTLVLEGSRSGAMYQPSRIGERVAEVSCASVICRHFGTCGGCSLVTETYDEQLAQKRAWLADLIGIDVPPLIRSPQDSGCRQKAAFVFGSGPSGRGLVMGHYAAR